VPQGQNILALRHPRAYLVSLWHPEAYSFGLVAPVRDPAGRVSSRILICKDVDEGGRWYFASDAESVKGRDLAVNPSAAASFYWPQHGRQIRISGVTASAGSEASAADFLARPPASRAAALIGRQSELLDDPADLDAAFRQSRRRSTRTRT
jgi:pyridoxamine 5'-phosphate oxidase